MELLETYIDLQKRISDSLLDTSGEKIGLAVSGGGDSLALLLVVANWSCRAKYEVQVATVDHGLRKESVNEAQFVKDVCASISIEHSILQWEKPEKINNVQNCARQARIRLLTEWAHKKDISTILLAHSADDQAETIMMNLIRGSGLEGLRGMPSSFTNEDIVFIRPFLSVGRARLRELLKDHKYSWIEDPSNYNHKYQRVKVRQILPQLSKLGLTTNKINLTGERMATASRLLRQVSASDIAKCVLINSWGELELYKSHFLLLPEEIQLRILTAVVGGLRGTQYRPRYKLIKSLLRRMKQSENKLSVTTCGLKITGNPNFFLFQREISAIPDVSCVTTLVKYNPSRRTKMEKNNIYIWDNRWLISANLYQRHSRTEIGVIKNKSTLKHLRKENFKMKYYTAAGLPAIFIEGKIVAMAGLLANDQFSFQVLYSKQTFIKRLENGQ